ncbi:FbpB family small basic protein [Bacillus alkalicellulosilyticus]|nr:FbpB family small basic protein [Bacillus alkalicellulosilyticus]
MKHPYRMTRPNFEKLVQENILEIMNNEKTLEDIDNRIDEKIISSEK